MNGKVVGYDLVEEKRYEDVQETNLVRIVDFVTKPGMCAAVCNEQYSKRTKASACRATRTLRSSEQYDRWITVQIERRNRKLRAAGECASSGCCKAFR